MSGDPGPELTHLDRRDQARMVGVGHKPVQARRAVAEALVRMSVEAAVALSEGTLPKGDAAAVARIAGIMAAKRTSELIPLCHPLPLNSVRVDFALDAAAGTIEIEATARTRGRTGVEMEALTAVAVAGLALIDMVKAADPAAVITDVRVEEKSGGKTGSWRRP